MALNAPVGHDVAFIAACALSAAGSGKAIMFTVRNQDAKMRQTEPDWAIVEICAIFGHFLLETRAFAHYIGADATNFRAMFSKRYQPIGRFPLAGRTQRLAERRYLLQKMRVPSGA